MNDVQLRVVHEPDDNDQFGCVVECHDHREPSVGEVIEWLNDRPDEWRFALEYDAQLVVLSDE
jgi:hypothetical protein